MSCRTNWKSQRHNQVGLVTTGDSVEDVSTERTECTAFTRRKRYRCTHGASPKGFVRVGREVGNTQSWSAMEALERTQLSLFGSVPVAVTVEKWRCLTVNAKN